MPESTRLQSNPSPGRNKRVIVLGAVLLCVFIVWLITMVVS